MDILVWLKGSKPTTKAQPIMAKKSAVPFLIVKGSLKKIRAKIVTNNGPVYKSVTAIDKFERENVSK